MTLSPNEPCRRRARVAAAAGALLLAACATVPPDAGKNPRDPLEKVNRQTFAFNDRLDRYLIKPIAQGYQWVLPRAVRQCISNGFANIAEIRNAVNDILQIKPSGVATDTGRLVINSTLGVAGCFDIATGWGLERRHEDFGLTLARWGLGTGPYIVLPVLGPSDARDGVGLVPDAYTSPTAYVQVMPVVARNSLLGTNLVSTRASLLDTTKLVEEVAIDRYQFTRDAYLQLRRSLEYEGNPPPPKLEDDDGGDSAPAQTPGPGPGDSGNKPAQPPQQDGR
jgi:phospholipid-binding lipoprotein MlaA